MARIQWDQVGNRFFEAGVDRGVLFIDDNPGVPWDGLTQVQISPDSTEVKQFYLDGFNYLNSPGKESFKATINAFYSPPEFDQCDGTLALVEGFYATSQKRKPFGLSYRSKIGNDVDGLDHGYKLHIIYNAQAAPVERNYNTLGEQVEASTLSWSLVAKPVRIAGAAPTAHFVVDSTKIVPEALIALEDQLYGSDNVTSSLPTIADLLQLIHTYSILNVVDNGDGTFTVSAPAGGPGGTVNRIDDVTYNITSDTITFIDDDSYTISSEE